MKPKFNHEYGGIRCRVCLVREGEAESVKISGPEDVFSLVKGNLALSDRERLLSIMLTVSKHLIGVETVSVGTLDSSLSTPREIFKSAILSNASGIVLCHNHPSGDLHLSRSDYAFTQKVAKAGKLLGIEVLDHIVISHAGYKSLREHGGEQIDW